MPASSNLARALVEEGFIGKNKDKWEWKGHSLIDTHVESILDVPTDFETDLLIILSSHRSKIDEPIITTHAPGNWHLAALGGAPSTLNTAPCFFMKAFFQEAKKLLDAEKSRFAIGLETDHHGPTCNVPICFVEIGSNEKYFEDANAARIAARAIMKALELNPKPKTGNGEQTTDPSPRHWKPAFVVGGGHYPQEANSLMITSEYAVGHTLAKFNVPRLTAETFRQAISKNVEGKATVLIVAKEFSKEQITRFKTLANECNADCKEI